ncbi:MAG: hypothetical protein EOO40_06785, partial [Deltaproteobacteria bacterium]
MRQIRGEEPNGSLQAHRAAPQKARRKPKKLFGQLPWGQLSTIYLAIFAGRRVAASSEASTANPVDKSYLKLQRAALQAAQQTDKKLFNITKRVLVVPPNSHALTTGGERNVGFFAMGLHQLGFNTTLLMNTGHLASLYGAMRIPSLAAPNLCVKSDAGGFAAVAETTRLELSHALNLAGHPFYPAQQQVDVLSTLVAEVDRRLTASDQDCPQDSSFSPAPGAPLSVLHRAIVLRRAAAARQADVVFTDALTDGLAAAVGLANSRHQPLWYVQSTAAQPPDAFLAHHSRVVTCGSGVRTARFARFPHVSVVANGVDTVRFAPRRAGSERPFVLGHGGAGALTIGNVAHLAGRKNQLAMVEAVGLRPEALAQAQLYFFGEPREPGYAKEMQQVATRLNI